MVPLQNSCLEYYTVYGLYDVRDNHMTVFYDEVGLIFRKQLGYENIILLLVGIRSDGFNCIHLRPARGRFESHVTVV